MKSNNFTQALKELTGFDAPAEDSREESSVQAVGAERTQAVPSFQAEEATAFSLDELVSEKTVEMSVRAGISSHLATFDNQHLVARLITLFNSLIVYGVEV